MKRTVRLTLGVRLSVCFCLWLECGHSSFKLPHSSDSFSVNCGLILGSSVSFFRVWTNIVLVARFHSTLFCVSVMEGVWSSPFEFPRVPDDEELDGDTSLSGTGGLSG